MKNRFFNEMMFLVWMLVCLACLIERAGGSVLALEGRNITLDGVYDASKEYPIVLTEQPLYDVVIRADSNKDSVIVAPVSLTFTASDYSEPQKFIITVIESQSQEAVVDFTIESEDGSFNTIEMEALNVFVESSCSEPFLAIDFNCDCVIDVLDLVIFLELWLSV